MDLPIEQRLSRLPQRFPVGAVYVVEGRGGEHGGFRVSSRYVLMPGGHRIDIPGGAGSINPELRSRAKVTRRNRPSKGPRNGPSNGRKILAARAKKFATKRGTTRRERGYV